MQKVREEQNGLYDDVLNDLFNMDIEQERQKVNNNNTVVNETIPNPIDIPK